MRNIFSKMFNTLPKRLATGAILALAIALPIAASASQTVTIAANTGVANITAGDTTYKNAVNATYDQQVKIQVNYTNTEAPSSNLVANNVHIKFTLPTAAGTSQVINTTTSGDNTNVVNGQATVNLDRADASLQYIPGSAVAKVTAVDGTITEGVVADNGSSNVQDFTINNGNPCQSASVTILARVMVPGVKITKQSEVLGQSNAWSANNTANPGDTLKYEIFYQNIGNTVQNDVIIRDNLPPTLQLVPGTTVLTNGNNPKGVAVTNDEITKGGIDIGGYNPGAGAYVVFQVKIPSADQLECGKTEYRNVGVARPAGMNEYYNTAVTDVTKTCVSQPVFTCDSLKLVQTGDRTVQSTVSYTAQNGATFKDVVIDFGDNTTPLTTTVTNPTYTYKNFGTYTVKASVMFTVNDKNQTVTSGNCVKTISFTAPSTPAVVTSATPPAQQLPNTGAGSVIGIFAGTAVVGAVAHRLFSIRRLARRGL